MTERLRTTSKRFIAFFLAAALVLTMLPVTALGGKTNTAQAATTINGTYTQVYIYDTLDSIDFYKLSPRPASWPKTGGDYPYDISYYISKVDSYYKDKLVRSQTFTAIDSPKYNFQYSERGKTTRFVVTFAKSNPTTEKNGPETFTDTINVNIAKGYTYSTNITKKVRSGTTRTLKFKLYGNKYNQDTSKSSKVKITKGKVTLKVGSKTYKGKLKKGVATFKKVYLKKNATYKLKLTGSNYWKNHSAKYRIY